MVLSKHHLIENVTFLFAQAHFALVVVLCEIGVHPDLVDDEN